VTKKEFMIFEKSETMVESICSDVVTFGFLLLCMWFSYSQGGGWWTFFTCSMFLCSLAVRLPGASARWVKLTTKKEAIEWAASLPDDEDGAA
jgi:hypothetical protein